MADLGWMNALEGKTKEIASTVYQGNLSDEEIALKYDSTVPYVQKIKSIMRKHGFAIPRYRSQVKDEYAKDDASNKAALRQSENLLVDRLTREDLRNIYADFKTGMSLQDVAVKHGLLPDLMRQLWRGWLQMVGRDNVVQLCDRYGPEGITQFNAIGLFLEIHKLTPESLVNRLDKIGDLEVRSNELEGMIDTRQNELPNLVQGIEELKDTKATIQTDVVKTTERVDANRQELSSIERRVEALRATEQWTQQHLDELLTGGRDFVYRIGEQVASDVLMNDRLLREKAVNELLNSISQSAPDTLVLLESIARGIKPNISFAEYTRKYQPLVEEARNAVQKRFHEKLLQEVSLHSMVSLNDKNRTT
jgi:hypothetical protein